jgi:hypothetical protein
MTDILEAYPAPARLIDARDIAARVHHGQPARKRRMSTVTGFCLHQAAVFATETAERWKNGGCHFAVFTTGEVLWLHDMEWNVAHGGLWNTATVGIEFNGRFEGKRGDPHTMWIDKENPRPQPPMDLTPAQRFAGMDLIRWQYSEGLKRGARWKALVAHRQASGDRRNDPGEQIWKEVALPLHAELGLTDGGIGFTLGDGLPIPEAWDPRCVGVRY